MLRNEPASNVMQIRILFVFRLLVQTYHRETGSNQLHLGEVAFYKVPLAETPIAKPGCHARQADVAWNPMPEHSLRVHACVITLCNRIPGCVKVV